jgi:hypothetical protein
MSHQSQLSLVWPPNKVPYISGSAKASAVLRLAPRKVFEMLTQPMACTVKLCYDRKIHRQRHYLQPQWHTNTIKTSSNIYAAWI